MIPESMVLVDPVLVDGISVRTSNADEATPERARIPALWARFLAGSAGQAGAAGPVYGVYSDYASDASGPYTLLIGQGRAGTAPPPGATDAVGLAPGRYLAFSSRGELPAAVMTGWQTVWAFFARPDAPRRLYSTDFELYDPRTPSEVRIHIAVE